MRCALPILVAVAAACAPERVEYRDRNPLSDRAKDEVDHTLPDGTRVVYRDPRPVTAGKFGATEVVAPTDQASVQGVGATGVSGPALELRIEHPDGTVELRAITPAQVIAHLQHAIRNREYPPFYSQMLTREARKEWEARGGEPAFAAWMDEQRSAVMEFLNRTSYGMFSSDVITRATGPKTIELQLTPQLHGQFMFNAIEFERQQGGLKLRGLR
ncbi:MAG: hypothetical protein FJ270_07300 [Planctomycetes bacterium]|nr:hypothetical protein [Planctomycetota bacterium]